MHTSRWVVVNNVPTSVKTWGSWIRDEIKSDSLILVIPGNPGITDFYEEFGNKLHTLNGLPVWMLCHAGNEIPPKSEGLKLPSNRKNPELYTLDGQVKHKSEFISTYIPQTKKIYLIGHSVGAKICVELLKKPEIAERVKQVHLMCPTLQYIADTPNGKAFRYFTAKMAPLLIAFAWVASFLPFKLLETIIRSFLVIYNMSFSFESCCINGFLKLATPKALKGVFFLANDEMVNLKELDTEVYEKYCNKMFAYFCQNDRWAPLYQYEDLKKKYSEINFRILDSSFVHSFVFKTSEAAAIKLSKDIQTIT